MGKVLEAMEPLRPCPSAWIDAQGAPLFGSYSGELREIAFGDLTGQYKDTPLALALRRKCWHYTFLSTPELMIVLAIADLGYLANTFLCAVDLRTRAVLFDESFLGAPWVQGRVDNQPGVGLSGRFAAPGVRTRVSRPGKGDRYYLSAHVSGARRPISGAIHLDAELIASGAPPPLTVIAPVPGGVVNVTQKSNALMATGSLTLGGRRFDLDGGVAGMDYTQGLLARNTSWRWAFAAGRSKDGTPLGFNLVEGFNEASRHTNENGFWEGDKLNPLPRARFTYNRNELMQPWDVTADQSVDLHFKPLYAHREIKDFKVIKSRFYHVLGLYSGTVRVGDKEVVVENLPGVTEDQEMRW